MKLGNSNNWTETSLTTSNAPTAVKVLGSLNQSFSTGISYTWNLDAASLKGGEKLSLIITHSGGSDVWFVSKEGTSSKRPKLKLTVPNTDPATVGDAAIPTEFRVQVYPNPFNPQTTIAIQNPQGAVDLRIYNALGQQVHAVPNYMESEYVWNAESMSTGLYFVRVSSIKAKTALIRKVMLVK
ncbi:MAG: T9SS C-terminal target domain-containing protein [Calditrichaeota bacterium]|nr:MAG: T9SS C-terminal target domain-containing protein [Calditrichota bacterium]